MSAAPPDRAGTESQGTERRRAERAGWAVAAVFFTVGLIMSAWFIQIPQFKAHLALSDAQLGVALLCPAAGALISIQIAGRLARKYGSAPLVRSSCLGVAVAVALVGASRGFAAFAAALLVFGLADGITDVSINAHAVAVESALGRPVLQRMHASFSLGSIVGALSGGAAIWAHLSTLGYLLGIAVTASVVAIAAATRLLPSAADRDVRDERAGRRGQAVASRRARARRGPGWSRFVIVLGLLGAGCLIAEGAAQSWGAVFLRDQRHAAPAIASAALLVFTVMQLGGRILGDRLHRRYGPVQLVRCGAALAGAGLCLELLPTQPGVAIAGIAIYSLGLSVLVPIIFGAVGHGSEAEHGSASVTAAVARFTTLSYIGYLLGPASIGWLAQGVGLTWALAAMFPVLGTVFGFARWTASALPGQAAPAGSVPAEPVPAGSAPAESVPAEPAPARGQAPGPATSVRGEAAKP